MLTQAQIHALLHSKGSLTKRLEALAGGPLGVQIIQEGFCPLSFDSKKRLGLPLAKPCLAWVRQVALYGNDNRPWVKACSIFPLDSLRGQGRQFKHLGNKPIGYLLFAKQQSLPHHRTIVGNTRQTVYDWQGQKILIKEQFL